VVACGDDHGVSRLLPGLQRTTSTYGLKPGAHLRGTRLREDGTGSRFEVVEKGRWRGGVTLRVPGRHNVLNALGAAGAARSLGVGWDAIREGLGGFKGVGRRFELLGEAHGVTVVDDYAHHPSEIRATLLAARGRFPGRRLIVVFQPHLFSRTRDFAAEFGSALAEADVVWVTDIYPAREAPIPEVSGTLVAQAALDAGAPVVSFHPALLELPAEMLPGLEPGDVCLTMGAGSIEALGGDLLAALRAQEGSGGAAS
jgi:UDP-N-acetylmuramate--alanine ligase